MLKNSVCIGNPVREAIEKIDPFAVRREKRGDKKLHILVLGGSRGAQAINRLVPEALGLLNNLDNVEIWHQAGDQKLEETLENYKAGNLNAKIDAFISDMPEAYNWADLVICRAGALTVSEIAAVGVGAIFIPFPYAIDDHQTANAKFLQEIGAAEIKQQSELTGEGLAEILKCYMTDSNSLARMAEAARQFAKPKAAELFADYCEELANA